MVIESSSCRDRNSKPGGSQDPQVYIGSGRLNAILARMKKCLLMVAVSFFAVAFSYGAFYLFNADEVSALDDLYELARTNPSLALDKVPQIMEANPEFMNRCHEITHKIGHFAYASLKERAFDFVRPMCGAGYLHGLLEEAVIFEGAVSLKDKVHQVCKEDQIESCLHGLGHAILKTAQSTHAAIDLCRLVTSEHTDCYDGVFMEHFDSESSSKQISYTDGLSVCLNMSSDVQPSCFFYLPRILKSLTATEVALECTKLTVPANFICAQGSGVMFMKYEPSFDKNSALSMCDAYVDPEIKQTCALGVENYSQFGSIDNSRWQ